MKEIIRCAGCANASLRLGLGFAGKDELICTHRSGTVEPDDGCTFGTTGTPGAAVYEYGVPRMRGDDPRGR